MTGSLSNLVDNLVKVIHKIQCKYGQVDIKCETCGIKYKNCPCFLENTNVKDNLIEYRCLCCYKDYKAWQAALEKTKVKLDFLTGIDLLLVAEEGIRGEMYHAIHRYAKANNKYMKNYDKNKESSYLTYWDVNNFNGWTMSQTLPVNDFFWVRGIFEFDEVFIKSYNEESHQEYFNEVDVQYPENFHKLHKTLPFYQKE